jgi:hypothetical protein
VRDVLSYGIRRQASEKHGFLTTMLGRDRLELSCTDDLYDESETGVPKDEALTEYGEICGIYVLNTRGRARIVI